MWVDLTTFDCYNDFIDFCRLLHQDEDDPEFMHQDFENFPKSWYCESSMGEETFDRIIEFSKLSTDERAAYECYLDDFNSKADIEEFMILLFHSLASSLSATLMKCMTCKVLKLMK